MTIQVIDDPTTDMVQANANVPHRLDNIRTSVSTFTRDLSRHQRSPASHIFVLMISSEQRKIKPYYALPVQCLPYHSINQQIMMQLVRNLMKEMKSRGMKVSGKLQV